MFDRDECTIHPVQLINNSSELEVNGRETIGDVAHGRTITILNESSCQNSVCSELVAHSIGPNQESISQPFSTLRRLAP